MVDPLRIARNGEPANLLDLWSPCPAFLACSGPSMNDHPLERLRERGIVSMGVNNAAAWAPVKAWCFSDPQSKFHHALFLDPSIMTFCPRPKMKRHVVVKLEDGFRSTKLRVRRCPNTYEFDRSTRFIPDQFFDTTFAHWGPGGRQPKDVPKVEGKWGVLCTMLIGIRLLYHLGVRTIYLLGVDYKGRDGKCYGFPGRKRERNRRYAHEGKMLGVLLPVFESHGLEIYNCNPDSDCKLFPHRSFSQAFDDCKGSIPPEPLDTVDWYAKKVVKEQCSEHDVFVPEHFGD